MFIETAMSKTTLNEILILEPFYGGSHKQLIDIICSWLQNQNVSYDLLTLPPKKWHWKARTSAIQFLSRIDSSKSYKTIFCSSVLNLCELIGLNPVFSKSNTVVYFHENQLEYPVQKLQERDFQYGYNQILTALAANTLLFNSIYNMESFLSKINKFLKQIPGFSLINLEEKIRPKCIVVYFPIISSYLLSFNQISLKSGSCDVLQIVWAHRWEYDKNPETFFNVLVELKNKGYRFQVSIMGEQFNEIPPIFEQAKDLLGVSYIRHWGFLEEKKNYYNVLSSSDVAVSTALHEFLGVSMIEAASLGCLPLCPNRLVYPEIFPQSCLYNTERQLFKRLKQYCVNKSLVKKLLDNIDFKLHRFAMDNVEENYMMYLCPTLNSSSNDS